MSTEEVTAVVLAAGTIVLVLVTAYYAWQTHQTVNELRRARGIAVLPHLALSLDLRGGAHAYLVLMNTGQGPALDVDITLSWGAENRHWLWPVMPQGSRLRFIGPPTPEYEMLVSALIARYGTIRLSGKCRDALGDLHIVEDELDLKAVWEADARPTYVLEPEYDKKMADELTTIRLALERIGADVGYALREQQRGEGGSLGAGERGDLPQR